MFNSSWCVLGTPHHESILWQHIWMVTSNSSLMKLYTHLGHILTYNLPDKKDIIRATKIWPKTFSALSNVWIHLLKVFCWNHSVYPYMVEVFGKYLLHIDIIQVALNHLLGKIWILPRRSHTDVCHSVVIIEKLTIFVDFTYLPVPITNRFSTNTYSLISCTRNRLGLYHHIFIM